MTVQFNKQKMKNIYKNILIHRKNKGLFINTKLPLRSSNPYATHIPILIALPRFFKITRVLEFGCGQYSTLLFLNRNIYTDLIECTSLENDFQWYKEIKEKVAGDARINMHYVNENYSQVIKELDFQKYNLILIDDSKNSKDRAVTICEVIKKSEFNNLIVVHDFEIFEYKRAASKLKNQFLFTSLNPCTGVLWKRFSIFKQIKLLKINKIIKKHKNNIEPDDYDAWNQILTKNIRGQKR